MADPAAMLRGVCFTYRGGERPALADVDLELRRGECAVLLGASGAGKSTLCLLLDGLIPHFVRGRLEGEVRVFGCPVHERPVAQWARDVGMVFQDFEAQLFSTNVELEVAFGPENLGVDPAEIRLRVAECLRTVGLEGLEDREPATLSGGQKQRLAIAATLALRPRLLVMDEPTTDLDPLGKEQVFAIARTLRARADAALLIAEHEVEEAAAADRVLVLDRGRLVADGPPQQVLARADWLEALGIHPPGGAQLLARLGLPPSLDVEAAARALRQAGWAPDPAAWARLREQDALRARRHGPLLVEVEDVWHRYPGGVDALRGVSLSVREGEFLALVGQNGSGKTTLAKHLNGLLRPRRGRVRVAGQDAAGRGVRELGRVVGYVFQNPDHQIFAETVFEEVAFGPRNHGLAGAELRRRVEEALAAVGLEGREGDDPFALTKGERQRLAVASVLATRPRAIVLDEPTTGLDHREQRTMMELIQRLVAAGHAVVCVTHNMGLVAEHAHRVVVMHEGRVLLEGTPREVMARERELRRAHLKPPHLVRVTNRLGATLLTLAECREALRRTAREAAEG